MVYPSLENNKSNTRKRLLLFIVVDAIITSTGIVELKFLKHGCPRSKNTITGERYNSGPLREQLLVGTMEQ